MWAVGAVELPGCSTTSSIPLSPFLRARNSETGWRRTDTFSVPLNLLVTH